MSKRYEKRSVEDIKRCIKAFNGYYALLREFIDKGRLKNSLDRGAFTHPRQILNGEIMDSLGSKRNKISFGYGQEAGEQILRDRIARLENLRHGTSYVGDNIAIVAGAWCGVELVLEEIAKLERGFIKKIRVAAIGPTHYQLFQRPIDVFGMEVIGFDFINFEGSTPQTQQEIEEILKSNPDVVFVTNPNNPVGEYFPPRLLRFMIEVCKKRNIKVVIDELQNFLPVNKKEIGYGRWIQSDNVIRIDSFSKHYALPEHRIGWVIAKRKYIGDRYEGVVSRLRGLMGNAPRAANDAILKLIDIEIAKENGKKDPLADKWNSIVLKESFIKNRLDKNSRITILHRDACFNLTFKVSGIKKDVELVRKLMENETLMMPCEGYGYRSEDVVIRITFAERWRKIRAGIQALESSIKSLKAKQ